MDEPKYWNEYLREWKAKERPKLRKLKKWLKDNDLIGIGGFEYQAKYINKVKKISGLHFSLRAWGALMSSIVNSKNRKKDHDYISYAWTSPSDMIKNIRKRLQKEVG